MNTDELKTYADALAERIERLEADASAIERRLDAAARAASENAGVGRPAALAAALANALEPALTD